MAEYTVKTHNISDPSILYQALITQGGYDVTYTINGSITINTELLSQSQINNAILDAADGTLFFNKAKKIQEVQQNTNDLLAQGVETWVAGSRAELSEDAADNYYTDYEYLTSNPSKISATHPYLVFTLDGRGLSTTSTADVLTLANNAADQLIYIYTAALNTDGSKGEYFIVQDILAATTQAALDAITDTRK